MRDALVAAGADPADVTIARPENCGWHVFVKGRHEHFTISVAIQCGTDEQGLYFHGNHIDADGEIYGLNPGFLPDDPNWVATTVLKYLKNPKWTTSHPMTIESADERPTNPYRRGA